MQKRSGRQSTDIVPEKKVSYTLPAFTSMQRRGS
jgi:hypothetical protein